MFGFNKPFPIDVPNAFFSNAAPSLRKQADAMDFEFPPPLNTNAAETAQQSLDRLRQVKNHLLKFEKQQANLTDSLSRHTGSARSSNRNDTATRAFPAYMHPASYMHPTYMPDNDSGYGYDEQNIHEAELAYEPTDYAHFLHTCTQLPTCIQLTCLTTIPITATTTKISTRVS